MNKLTVVHCTPKPNADLCICMDLPLDKKLWKIRTGPPGCRAIAGRGPLDRGPLGLRVVAGCGPWAAGRWATGLFLAKPVNPGGK